MRKYITIEFIESEFKKEGYKLLSEVYVKECDKLSFICTNGHHYSMSWNAWQRGSRCVYCSKRAPINYEQVKESFEKEGYTLLSTEYVNNKTKLNFICHNGHNHFISWDVWRRGVRCLYCANNSPKDFEQIKKSFSGAGYTLLSTYEKAHAKLDYICPMGHRHSISWSNWIKGNRCQTCKAIKHTGPGNPSWRGGVSYEPYCPIWKDKEYKKSIRERDNHICQNFMCNSKKGLTIHHINYVKKDCHPNNLITLCNSCNSKANTDREWHQSFYTELIRRKTARVLSN